MYLNYIAFLIAIAMFQINYSTSRRIVGLLPKTPISKVINNIEIFANQILAHKEQSQTTLLDNIEYKHKTLYLEKNDFIKNKKMISVSPAGFKGFYLLGVIKYIKENYDLSEYIFSGASAGAWNSLLLSYNGDISDLFSKVVNEDMVFPQRMTILEFEQKIKRNILNNFNESDFDLRRVFIGVTTINNLSLQTSIYSNFHNLEDALDCCISSSHIPFITGGPINKYHDIISFDGGFSDYPYLASIKSSLHITPSIWMPNKSKKIKNINDYTTLLSKYKYNFMELYEMGYTDTKNNAKTLDTIFNKHTNI